MKSNETYGVITKLDANGKECVVAKLDLEEYEAFQRAMQWPEDLAKWDRLHAPIKAGFGKHGIVFFN